MPAPTNLPGPQSAVDGLQVLRNAVVVVRRRRTTAVAGGPLARRPRPEPTLPHATAVVIARAYCASHPQCPSHASKSGAGTYWTATYETLSKRRDHKPWRKATTFLGSGQQEVTTKVPAGRGRGWSPAQPSFHVVRLTAAAADKITKLSGFAATPTRCPVNLPCGLRCCTLDAFAFQFTTVLARDRRISFRHPFPLLRRFSPWPLGAYAAHAIGQPVLLYLRRTLDTPCAQQWAQWRSPHPSSPLLTACLPPT
ncbi:uncharacterized protein SEPMUDRAFT_105190 [Sphaerulina musiva SO2202]|uniref:Uncharacterized protein n=1 Tax=Sphaerulina musiva (strain SO2202) TaxID=692275 RepID=N1QLE8_SPHMS|nr:uncharacterized protein SEPMUDRAFT_105190 [Sphaerulina musiva SO2202]EMF18020.1 hypothetical protein SEPMUDRAFT_105190 [Sphaerulina musiva SO2202]